MSEIPVEQINKLLGIIESFSRSCLPKESATLKGRFTRTVNQWAKTYGVTTARETALNLVSLLWLADLSNPQLQLLLKRLTVGSLYRDGGSVWGWYCPETQAQAERVPLSINSDFIAVRSWGFTQDWELWKSRGFDEAMGFPYLRNDHPFLSNLIVTINQKDADFWKEYGYAMPKELQYEREEDSLTVTRNLKEYGFWRAYKWWKGCQNWYKEKHPEWFEYEAETTPQLGVG